MKDKSQTQSKRRRLFTRRELRHSGTRIVRVGSTNVVESNRGQYNFAALNSTVQPSPSDKADDESITTFSERDCTGASQQTASNVNKFNTKLGKRRDSKRTMHRLTQMSERSRCLKVSPNKRRTLTPQLTQKPDDILSPSPTRLPPPLNLDRNILSFSQHTPLSKVGRTVFALSDRPPLLPRQPLSAKTNNFQHLTPLRSVQQRLKPAKTKIPPAFSLDKLLRRIQK